MTKVHMALWAMLAKNHLKSKIIIKEFNTTLYLSQKVCIYYKKKLKEKGKQLVHCCF